MGAELDAVARLSADAMFAAPEPEPSEWTPPRDAPGAAALEREVPNSPVVQEIWTRPADVASDGTTSKYRFGKIFFEETGKMVPYVIAPNEVPPGVDDAAEIIKILVKHGGLKKPSIRFDVRARGHSYLQWPEDLYNNDIIARAWQWRGNPHPGDDCDLSQARRSFGKKMLHTFQACVQGVVDADGWFFFQAGRRPRHQLIGDAIDVYGGSLNDVTWVQYAALQYENFGRKGETHDQLVGELIRNSVEVKLGVDPNPTPVTYANEDQMYPDAGDLQGKNATESASFMEEKLKILYECKDDVPLHPHTSHFIFWDTKGQPSKNKTGQHLPWDRLKKLEDYLSKQGIMEGVILANGDKGDFDACARHTERSNPVVTLKSTGGAADVLAQEFERRIGTLDQHTGEIKDHLNRTGEDIKYPQEDELQGHGQAKFFACEALKGCEVPRLLNHQREVPAFAHQGCITQGLPYPDDALVPEKGKKGSLLGNVHFNHTDTLDDSELMLVDVVDPLCGQLLQRNMADMLTKGGGEDESKLGFGPAERARIEAAWDDSIIYRQNANAMKLQASFFNYLMLLLNTFIVVCVVYKQVNFPAMSETCKMGEDGHLQVIADGLKAVSPEKVLKKHLVDLMLVCVPIVNGIVLTLNSQFSPLSKYNALLWAAEQCTSEVYRYRTRTHEYNSVATSDANLPEEKKWKLPEEKKTSVAKMFMDRLTYINEQVSQDSGMSSDSMSSHDKTISKAMFDKATHGKSATKLGADKLQTSQYKSRKKLLASLPGGAVAKEDETGEAGDIIYEWQNDDGFSCLNSQEYVAVRTIPGLSTIEHKLPSLGLAKQSLQALIYIATSVSVMLGTLHYDIYIAISTAMISLLTGIMEYEKLERRIVILNSSKKGLESTLKWWHALSFVDRRQPTKKDELVERTEDALVAESISFYSEQNPRVRERNIEEQKTAPKKKKAAAAPPPVDYDSGDEAEPSEDANTKPQKGSV